MLRWEKLDYYICSVVSSHTLHTEAQEIYFCTITCYKWLNLIEEAQAYKSVYRWFEHLKKDGCFVAGFVIMPNHFHVLLFLTHSGTSLSLLVGECKRFMAYDIVNGLKRKGKNEILKILHEGVAPKERLQGKLHEVFRSSFDARACYTERMVEQKLDYIHHNPVQGKWSLVDDFTKYRHSSAGFYESGEQGMADITHYKDLSG